LFDHLPVHERLPAEKVHLKIGAGAGMGNEKINGLFPHIKGHERPLAVKFPLAGKAIVARQIAGMGHMQAEGLDDGVSRLEISGHGLRRSLRKKASHCS
jgi:hypothetical protein